MNPGSLSNSPNSVYRRKTNDILHPILHYLTEPQNIVWSKSMTSFPTTPSILEGWTEQGSTMPRSAAKILGESILTQRTQSLIWNRNYVQASDLGSATLTSFLGKSFQEMISAQAGCTLPKQYITSTRYLTFCYRLPHYDDFNGNGRIVGSNSLAALMPVCAWLEPRWEPPLRVWLCISFSLHPAIYFHLPGATSGLDLGWR